MPACSVVGGVLWLLAVFYFLKPKWLLAVLCFLEKKI
jgi:hypothetical protein